MATPSLDADEIMNGLLSICSLQKNTPHKEVVTVPSVAPQVPKPKRYKIHEDAHPRERSTHASPSFNTPFKSKTSLTATSNCSTASIPRKSPATVVLQASQQKYLSLNPAFQHRSLCKAGQLDFGGAKNRESEEWKSALPLREEFQWWTQSSSGVSNSLGGKREVGVHTPSDSVSSRGVSTPSPPSNRPSQSTPSTICSNQTGQCYSDSTRELQSFSTVGGLWSSLGRLPQPSDLVVDAKQQKFQKMVIASNLGSESSPETVDALMLFKTGITPEWEDPFNKFGGHIQFTAHLGLHSNRGGEKGLAERGLPSGLLDEFWNNLVLAFVGGGLERETSVAGGRERELNVTGIRLVDKLSSPRPCVRFEVWLEQWPSSEEELAAFTRHIQENIFSRSVLGELRSCEKNGGRRKRVRGSQAQAVEAHSSCCSASVYLKTEVKKH